MPTKLYRDEIERPADRVEVNGVRTAGVGGRVGPPPNQLKLGLLVPRGIRQARRSTFNIDGRQRARRGRFKRCSIQRIDKERQRTNPL
jgi:hypothetical protein